ncbi:MAG: hypothetical protein M5U26_20265 [Planctomycetota bacterium]|nr:hypothetical protein [Planctomycetota bacterium]
MNISFATTGITWTFFSNMTRVFVSDFKNEYYDTADTTLAMMCGLYRVTQDAALLEKIKSYFRAMTDSNSDIGLNEEFWKTRGNALYKSFRKAFNFLQYYDLTGDDAARSVIVKLQVKNVYAEPYMQPFYYQHRNGAIFGRLYEWTNDDDCLYWARHQLSGAKELFEKFFALPPESRGMAHLLKNMPGPGATGGSGGQFIFDGVTFESSGLLRGKGRLYFGGDAFPAAISLPMALWAIKGFPDSAE